MLESITINVTEKMSKTPRSQQEQWWLLIISYLQGNVEKHSPMMLGRNQMNQKTGIIKTLQLNKIMLRNEAWLNIIGVLIEVWQDKKTT